MPGDHHQLPMTSVPFGGVKLKVPAAKPGLRFQPLKLITVRWPTASVIPSWPGPGH